MNNKTNLNKVVKLVAVFVVLSVFALVGTATAEDCVVPKASVSVGGASVDGDEFEAIRSGLGRWDSGEGRTFTSARSSVDVGLSRVAAADFNAIRDIVSGETELADASGTPQRAETVNVGLFEIDRNDLSEVESGLGKAPVKKSGNCA